MRDDVGLAPALEVFVGGHKVPRPTLLSLDIANVGETTVVDPPISVEVAGTTMFPGYIQDPPAGYGGLWSVGQVSPEQASVTLGHIKAGQVARVRLLLSDPPAQDPVVSCPMPDTDFVDAHRSTTRGFVSIASDLTATVAAIVVLATLAAIAVAFLLNRPTP